MLELAFLTKEDGLIMGPISRILGWILNGIYEFLSMFTKDVNGIGMVNIALCIVLFTIIIKMLMIPLTIKQQKSAKLSSHMSPELTAISEKYRGKTDEASRMKMQKETQAVYEKYGTNPMAGCLMILITFPIIIALYRVIYSIPAYINDVRDMYSAVAEAIKAQPNYVETLTSFVKEAGITEISIKKFAGYSSGKLSDNNVIDILSKCNESTWKTLAASFPQIEETITSSSKPILEVHQFLGGLNILNKPVQNGNYFSIGILIPIFATLSNFLQSKLAMAKTGNQNDAAASSMKMMNVFFPIMSGFICLMMPIGAGIYWIVSSVVQIIQQFFINKYMDKISVEELIAKNQEKRAKKLKKMGIDTGTRMAEVAKTSTKSIEVKQTNTSSYDSKKDVIETDNNNEVTEKKTVSGSKGSISDYANILKNRSGK